MKRYVKQTDPFRVPVTDDKLIEEYFGNASTGESQYSVAHMIAPPGWEEPHQNPEFDEITIMISGKKEVEIDGETIDLKGGETLLVRRGARVRYRNPFDEPAEYWSVCLPAFSIQAAHREEPDAGLAREH
jgi:mannose-6-phosphate isomerase-like protein (cupin superfamily)